MNKAEPRISFTKAARQVRMNFKGFRAYIEKNNIKTFENRYPQELIQEILSLRQKNWTYPRIGKHLGVSEQMIFQMLSVKNNQTYLLVKDIEHLAKVRQDAQIEHKLNYVSMTTAAKIANTNYFDIKREFKELNVPMVSYRHKLLVKKSDLELAIKSIKNKRKVRQGAKAEYKLNYIHLKDVKKILRIKRYLTLRRELKKYNIPIITSLKGRHGEQLWIKKSDLNFLIQTLQRGN